ncbi:hypothetical protein HY501_03875 [Candidatus Woesearchaeota archaeon]|nr:hypothetical protein [Candidatus Woesearchaeota archaeon]
MKIAFIFLLLAVLPLALADDIVYSITLIHENGDFLLENVQLYTSVLPDKREAEDYNYIAKVVSFNGKVLDEQEFIVDSHVYDLEIELERQVVVLFFPYYENAGSLQVFTKEGRKAAEFSLASFAQCNEDERCDPFENENCSDCREREIHERLTPTAIEETAPLTETKEEVSRERILIVALFLAAITAALIALLRKKGSKTV